MRCCELLADAGFFLQFGEDLCRRIPVLVLHGFCEDAAFFLHEFFQGGGVSLGVRCFCRVELAVQDLLEKRFVELRRMAYPRDVATLGDDEGGRDAVLSGGFHPVDRHESLFLRSRIVRGDAVGHFFAHLGNKRLHFGEVALPAILSDEDDTLVFEMFVEFIEMRNGGHARPAPRRPKLHHIDSVLRELLHGVALDPFADLKLGSGRADFEFCFRKYGRGGRCERGECEDGVV